MNPQEANDPRGHEHQEANDPRGHEHHAARHTKKDALRTARLAVHGERLSILMFRCGQRALRS